MDKEIVRKIENFIQEKNHEAAHMLRTGFWLREIDPEADDIFYVAAIAHDIERCFPLREGEVKPPKTLDDKDNEEYLKWHGSRSAEFAEGLLVDFGYDDKEGIEKIKKIISEHSFGGTKERDLMMDADSVSFFENNAKLFIKEHGGKEALKRKFTSEFDRIKNEKARQLGRPFYERALEELEKS